MQEIVSKIILFAKIFEKEMQINLIHLVRSSFKKKKRRRRRRRKENNLLPTEFPTEDLFFSQKRKITIRLGEDVVQQQQHKVIKLP